MTSEDGRVLVHSRFGRGGCPRASIEFIYEDNGAWKYPGLLLQFKDGSQCTVYGEKRWGLEGIAATQ